MRAHVGFGKIIALEQKPRPKGFGARVRQAISEIELRGMSALAVSLKALDGQPTDSLIDWNFGQPGLRRQAVEEVLCPEGRERAAAVEPTGGERH